MVLEKFIINEKFDSIVLIVSNNKFSELDINNLKKKNSFVYDVKNYFKKDLIDQGPHHNVNLIHKTYLKIKKWYKKNII